ncbi:alpha/beta-hydrolase, partial [Serendipita vermifera]
RRKLTWFGGIYALFVLVLALPGAQKHALYLHRVQVPLWPRFDTPEKYGLAPGRALNRKIMTSDNISLGSWFVFAETYYQTKVSGTPSNITLNDSDMLDSLRSRPTILMFHGNAGSRATWHRVRFCATWTSRLDANVLIVDYRGFGDSEGTPSEKGLETDAKAAWDWLIERGAQPSNILLFGHSLGTGVVAKLGYELTQAGIKPRGAVFAGAFTDLATLLETYNVGGWIPLLQPFQLVPFFFSKSHYHPSSQITDGLTEALDMVLYHKFSTITLLPNITAPILLVHAENDFDIQTDHSQRLFDATLEPYLEPYPFSETEMRQLQLASDDRVRVINEVAQKRRIQKEALVSEVNLGRPGKFSTFERTNQGTVNLFRSTWGGHDGIINYESVMDITKSVFGL